MKKLLLLVSVVSSAVLLVILMTLPGFVLYVFETVMDGILPYKNTGENDSRRDIEMKIKFKRLTETAKLPSYAHAGDSGMDICTDENVVLRPRRHLKISTGIAAVIPDGYEIQVRPRSGIASKGVVAAFGTVDSGYRGEIGVTLYNHTDGKVLVSRGDRIAQLVLAPVVRAEIEETDDLGEQTERGADGFGSTGL